MRICVVSYHSSPLEPVGAGKSGGMSIVIRSLYQWLSYFADIDIFVRGDERIVEVGPRIRVVHIDRPDTCGFAEAIVNFSAVHKYDLLHTHYWLSGIIGLQIYRLLRIPWLHTLHTVEILKTVRRDKTRIEIEEEIVRSCDLVVSPTQREAAAIRKLYPDARVMAIPHGVDTQRFMPSQNGHKNILFVGRIDPIKGLHLLIDALRLVKRDINLTVVGGPSKGARNFESIMTYAAGMPVEFVGQVKHEILAEYYSKTSMLVVPSYYESFGLVGLEAMASARPVVGFSHTGLKETVSNDAGFLVRMGARNLAKAIDRLANDSELRYTLGANGRRKARAYDWSIIARRYRRLYEKIIQK
jgi:D-inositol-3-phosphate glycosyltransferase